MQVRDLIEQLQQFDGRSEVVFEIAVTPPHGEIPYIHTERNCEVKRGPDTARIILES